MNTVTYKGYEIAVLQNSQSWTVRVSEEHGGHGVKSIKRISRTPDLNGKELLRHINQAMRWINAQET